MTERQSVTSILIIDDDLAFAASLEKTLGKAGHRIVVANDGVEGLRLLSTASFDVVITDFRLGFLSGLQVLSSIRHRELPVRVVLLTAFRDEELTTTAGRLGADACLSKPVKRSEILECVSHLLSQKVTNSELSHNGGSCST